jgi:hypothetical protein
VSPWQLVRSQPEAHSASGAVATEAGKSVDPSRLVRLLMSLGEVEEAKLVAKLFGIA